ncbi:protein kinase, partial [candidate division KSB1 bacterium]
MEVGLEKIIAGEDILLVSDLSMKHGKDVIDMIGSSGSFPHTEFNPKKRYDIVILDSSLQHDKQQEFIDEYFNDDKNTASIIYTYHPDHHPNPFDELKVEHYKLKKPFTKSELYDAILTYVKDRGEKRFFDRLLENMSTFHDELEDTSIERQLNSYIKSMSEEDYCAYIVNISEDRSNPLAISSKRFCLAYLKTIEDLYGYASLVSIHYGVNPDYVKYLKNDLALRLNVLNAIFEDYNAFLNFPKENIRQQIETPEDTPFKNILTYTINGYFRALTLANKDPTLGMIRENFAGDMELIKSLITRRMVSLEDFQDSESIKAHPFLQLVEQPIGGQFKRFLAMNLESRLSCFPADRFDESDMSKLEGEYMRLRQSYIPKDYFDHHKWMVDSMIHLSQKSKRWEAHIIYFDFLNKIKSEPLPQEAIEEILKIEPSMPKNADYESFEPSVVVDKIIINDGKVIVNDAINYFHTSHPYHEKWSVPDWKLTKYIARGAYGIVFDAKGKIGGKKKVVKIFDLSPDAMDDIKIIYNLGDDASEEEILGKLSEVLNQEGMSTLEELLEPDEAKYLLLPSAFISNVRSTDGLVTYASVSDKLETTLDGKIENGEYDSLNKYLPLIKEILQAAAIVHKKRKVIIEGEEHEKRFVHNDIKPSNVGFDKYTQLKLFDFGIATTLSTLYKENYPNIGSLEMRAPELKAIGSKPDTRSDVWQLGCLIYHLLTQDNPYDPERPGKPPFDYKRPPKGTEERKKFEEERPERIKKEIPLAIYHLKKIGRVSTLVDIVANCLQFDKEKRYDSAKECLE